MERLQPFLSQQRKDARKSRSGVRSREQISLVTHPDSGPELKL
jgi:hypothetical protein